MERDEGVASVGCTKGEAGNLRLVRVADDEGDAGKRSEIFRSALSIATGGDDAGAGVGGVNLADSVAGLGVGRRSDGAGVDDDEVSGVRGGGERESEVEKLALDGGAVGVGSATAELFDVKGVHAASEGPGEFTIADSRKAMESKELRSAGRRAARSKAHPPPHFL